MGICAIQHRVTTGKYNSNLNFSFVCNSNNKYNRKGKSTPRINHSSVFNIFCLIYYIVVIYMMFSLMGICIEVSLKPFNSYSQYHSFHKTSGTYSTVHSTCNRDYVNSCFFIVILSIFRKYCHTNINYRHIINPFHVISKKNYSYVSTIATLSLYTYWVALLNLILIIICSPVIINPGPNQKSQKLSVFFQNVRGFISPNQLGEPNPNSLNLDKVSEFQSYIFEKKPDIVILNETWLSKNK